MVNMGEIFAHRRIGDIRMDRVPISRKEAGSYLLQPGDLLFARQSLVRAGAGKCSIFVGAPEPVTFESHLIRARLDRELADPRFYFYFFDSPAGRQAMESIIEQVAAAGIRGSDLAELPVPVPALVDQSAVADLLGSLDDKIELNRRMNETLEALAQAAFEKRLPDDATGTVADVATLSRASVVPMESPEERFDHYSIPAFDAGAMPASDLGSEIRSSKLLVPPDAVLISKLNPRFPRVWRPTVSGERRSICSTEFLVTRPRAPFTREYVFCLFRSARFQEVFRTLVTGTSGSHQRVKAEHMLALPTASPSAAEIEAVTATARPLLERVALNRREGCALAELRDTLLPKLISGEIRVRAGDGAIEVGNPRPEPEHPDEDVDHLA